jgi:hypothetical protein
MRGTWRYEPTWPAERLRPTPLALNDSGVVAPVDDGGDLLETTITSSAPIAYLSAKLCDVFPDGAASLATRTMLNLAHRDSHEEVSTHPRSRSATPAS